MAKTQLRGRCQVCFMDVAVKPKKGTVHHIASLHGYERPGIGYIFGRCWGAGKATWETDCSLLRSWIVEVRDRLIPNTEKLARDLRALRVEKVTVYEINGVRSMKRGARPVEYTAQTKFRHGSSWATFCANEAYSTEQTVKQMRAELKDCEERVATWKFAPEAIRKVVIEDAPPFVAGEIVKGKLYGSEQEVTVLRMTDIVQGWGTRHVTGWLVRRSSDQREFKLTGRQLRAMRGDV